MKEISLHILDIVQNSINAGANLIEIDIMEDTVKNLFSVEIIDNGQGMSKEILVRINDPFFTTKNKKTGLGIPLLRQHAELCGGALSVKSEEKRGTRVTATFIHDHIDRQPLGDMVITMINLIRSYPDIDFIYNHRYNQKKYRFDTRDVKEELGNISIRNSNVIAFIREMLSENLVEIATKNIVK